MIRRPPRSTPGDSSAASDVYKRQIFSSIPGNPSASHLLQCPRGSFSLCRSSSPVSQGVLQLHIFSNVPGGPPASVAPSASVVHLFQCPRGSFSFTPSPVSQEVLQPLSFNFSSKIHSLHGIWKRNIHTVTAGQPHYPIHSERFLRAV